MFQQKQKKPIIRITADDKKVDGKQPLLEKNDGKQKRRTSSVAASVFNLATTVVGAGIMSLPATIKILGVPLGLLMLLAVGALTYFSIEILLRYTAVTGSCSYGDIMAASFGAAGRLCLQIFVIVKTVGILITYLIIIVDVISGTTSGGTHKSGVLEEWFGMHWWSSRLGVLFLTTAFVLLPLVSFKYVDSLKVSSAISIALALVFMAITATITLIKLIHGDIYKPRVFPQVKDQASYLQLFQAIPVIVTAYLCHYNVHPIRNELKDPAEMEKVSKYSIGLCSVLYVSTALFGYLLFGEKTLSDVLANFNEELGIPYSDIFSDTVRLSYAVHLMLVFPVANFALRLNCDELLFPGSASALVSDSKRFFFITTVLMLCVFLGAAFIPDIWYVFQVLGATVDVSISFIFPALIVLRDAPNIANRKDKALAWLMVMLSVVSSCIAFSTDIYDLIKTKSL